MPGGDKQRVVERNHKWVCMMRTKHEWECMMDTDHERRTTVKIDHYFECIGWIHKWECGETNNKRICMRRKQRWKCMMETDYDYTTKLKLLEFVTLLLIFSYLLYGKACEEYLSMYFVFYGCFCLHRLKKLSLTVMI